MSANSPSAVRYVAIALDQMWPTSCAFGGFEAPLNQFADITLVFEDVERPRPVEEHLRAITRAIKASIG